MQTFLPFAEFEKSAKALDRQRLGKQRVEAWQILQVVLNKSGGPGWRNHPAVEMWRENPATLIEYGLAMCREWKERGYVDNMEERFLREQSMVRPDKSPPEWLGDPKLHRSHQSNLLRKDAEHYKAHFPKNTPKDLPYMWPGVDASDKIRNARGKRRS